MTERNKVVIRHLPPALPEEVFWKTLSPWIEPTEKNTAAKCLVTYKSYIPGKLRQTKGKVDLPSRAYLHFATVEDLVEFHQGYAQQAFRDSRGNITIPKIEFAPFQKIPTPAKKVDPRCGTIDSSQDYQLFLKRLESPLNQETEEDSNQTNTHQDSTKTEIPKITPLIQHLRSLRIAAQAANIAQKQAHRSVSTSTKVSSNKEHELPPHQIVKRGVSSSNHPSGSLPPPTSSSSKPIKSRALPSSSKPSKLNPTTGNASKGAGASSGPKPSVVDPIDPKLQPSSSKPKRGKKAIDHTQTKPIEPSTTNHPKPIPMKIVTRPKEILSKPTVPSSGLTESSKTPKPTTQDPTPNQSNPVTTQEGRSSGKKPSKAAAPSTSRTNSSSKRTEKSSSIVLTPPENESRGGRGRVTEETAGARRRLGMALAGIGGANERKSSRKDVQNHPANV